MTALHLDIGINHVLFAVIASATVLVAWSPLRRWFLVAFGLASLIMIGSWLSLEEVLAATVFLAPPYLVTAYLWGRPDRAEKLPVIGLSVAYVVATFIILRRYDWLGGTSLFDHGLVIIGLSYMLFRVIHLLIEAPYLQHHRFGLWRYVSYVTAFWTLLSGPIQRYDSFSQGLATIGRPTDAEALAAAHRTVNGLIKAFIFAPLFLPLTDPNLLRAPDADWVDFALVYYAYPIYLYLNFSGYTDAMIGISRLCGMKTMPENFNRPYLARNIQDFWTRWHISFGLWIKAFLFTPLMKRLVAAGGRGRENTMMALAVIITFLIVGAWHGTTYSFLLFGLLHGLGVMVAALWGGFLAKRLGRKGRKAFESHPAVRTVAILLCIHYVFATLTLVPNDLDTLVGALRVFFGG